MASATAWHDGYDDKDGNQVEGIVISCEIKISDCTKIIELDMFCSAKRGSKELQEAIDSRKKKVRTIISAMNLILDFYKENEDSMMGDGELEYVEDDEDRH